MRRFAVAMVALGLLITACGGDEDTSSGTTAGTGPTGTAVEAPGVDDGRDLASVLHEQADVHGAAIDFTDAQCYAEMLEIVLGPAEARAAVDAGAERVDEALGDYRIALDDEGDPAVKAELADKLQPMSDFCWDHMRLSRILDVEDREAAPLGP